MEERKNRLLVLAIAITVFAAIFVSFGVPALSGHAPSVTLADITQPAVEEPGETLLPVRVTPNTVQNVIATLVRPESYTRSLSVTLYWGEDGSAAQQVRIWAQGDLVKTTVTAGSGVQHRLVGNGKLYLWYEGDQTWKELPAQAGTADLAQRIPTYETVLDLETDQITGAGYEDKNGRACIYVEVADPEGSATDRYWIETATGLLTACESLEGERVVYSMEETAYTAPMEETDAFLLPDGSDLSSSVQEERGGESE